MPPRAAQREVTKEQTSYILRQLLFSGSWKKRKDTVRVLHYTSGV